MKIIECSPFFNENLIADVHIHESSKWVDEIHITESNRTLQFALKSYDFSNQNNDRVYHHRLDVNQIFLKPRKYIPYFKYSHKPAWHPKLFRNTSWYNEGMQRKNFYPDFEDDDILIFSDIDEIINFHYADKIIDEVQKRGIITVKLYFTVFYFNLFSMNWGGPPDYSYRVFAAKGKVFRKIWNCDYDTLRKMGERSRLLDTVYCLPEIAGFHHSWIGDEQYISQKLKAYTHTEHRIYDDRNYISQCLKEGKSIFPGHNLEVRNDIKLLNTIEENKPLYAKYFFRRNY